MNDKYYQKSVASELEYLREKARFARHIAYDCFNAKCRGNTVYCSKGYWGRVKSLASVLKGASPWKCRSCPDYDTE